MIYGNARQAHTIASRTLVRGLGDAAGCSALTASRDIAVGQAEKWSKRVGKALYPNAAQKAANAQAEVQRLNSQIAAAGGCAGSSGSSFPIGPVVLLGAAAGALLLARRRRR